MGFLTAPYIGKLLRINLVWANFIGTGKSLPTVSSQFPEREASIPYEQNSRLLTLICLPFIFDKKAGADSTSGR